MFMSGFGEVLMVSILFYLGSTCFVMVSAALL